MSSNDFQSLGIGHWFFGPLLRNKKFYIKVIIASVFINVFALVSAFYIMVVYDMVIPNNAIESLVALTVGVLLIVVFDFVMKLLRGLYTDRASTLVDTEVSEILFERISRNEQLLNKQVGAVASVIKDFDLIKDFIASATFVAFVDLPFIILFLIVIYGIGGPIAVVPTMVLILVIIVGLLIQPVVRKLSFNTANDGQSKQSVIVELLSGMETLKTLRGIGVLRNRWIDSVSHQGVTGAKSKFWSQLTTNFSQSGQQLSQIGIIVYGVFLISDSDLTMGSLIACVILSGRALSPLGLVSNLLGRLNHALTAYSNLDKLMGEPVTETNRLNQIRLKTMGGNVVLRNVSLKYPTQKEATIKNLNLEINAGEKIAIVGKVGSGKTSLLRLIVGLYEPSEGSIKIDQLDISHLHPDDMRKHIGVVMQTSLLFSGTLKENLLMGNPDATDEQVLQVAKVTGVNYIASNLPNGYETVLTERGLQLSGGQRQAICIARSLIGDPKVIIMDEPTSAMDPKTEQELLLSLTPLLVGKTFIVITHRRSLFELVDRIVLLDGGRVTADGPKDKVLKVSNQKSKNIRDMSINVDKERPDV